VRYLLPLLLVALQGSPSFAEPRPGPTAAIQQVIRNGIANGKSEEEIQQRLETLGLVPVEVRREESNEESYSTHGGADSYAEADYAEPVSRTSEQVGLPAVSNLQSAREALEEEVRRGRLPREAVEPLLAKIAPTVEKFADRLTAAGENDKKIRDILKDLPKFSLEYTRGEEGTQVVAQVVNGVKEETSEQAPTFSNGSTVPTQTVPAPQAYNQPAPPVVVLQAQPSAGGTTSTTISKQASNGPWLTRLGETGDKISTTRRPIADGGRGVASVVGSSNLSSSGTGMGTEKNSGTFLAKGSSAVKALVREWISAVKGEPETRELAEIGGESTPVQSGFSVLKNPKLSSSAAILRLPEAAWSSTRTAARAWADEWNIPEWLRMVALLSGVATAMCLLWLIWRRRNSARRL